jgi:RES domain-containing protein
LYRLCKTRYRHAAFNGEGARQFGGRWNSVDTPLIYCSASLAAAMLEVMVHTQRNQLLFESYVYFEFEIDDQYLLKLNEQDYPATWQYYPATSATQSIGDAFYQSYSAAGLLVLSALSICDYHCLLDPHHEMVKSVTHQAKSQSFAFDNRLVEFGDKNE